MDIAFVGAMTLIAGLLVYVRTNAAIVFLSLCAGSLLLKYAGSDVSLAANAFSAASSSASTQIAELTVLLLPALLSAVVLRKSVSGLKWLINILPAAGVGLTAGFLAVPLLPGGVQAEVTGTQVWSQLQQYRDFIIATSILISLLVLWFSASKKGSHKHGKNK